MDVASSGTRAVRGHLSILPQDQRLLANPFLAILVAIPWGFGFRWAFLRKSPTFLLILLGLLPCIAYFLQYHCLDCGATGRFFRWRSHACSAVIARCHSERRTWFRPPNPTAQVILWGYFLVAAYFLGLMIQLAR